MSDDKQQKAALEYTSTFERIHYVHQEWSSLLETKPLFPQGISLSIYLHFTDVGNRSVSLRPLIEHFSLVQNKQATLLSQMNLNDCPLKVPPAINLTSTRQITGSDSNLPLQAADENSMNKGKPLSETCESSRCIPRPMSNNGDNDNGSIKSSTSELIT